MREWPGLGAPLVHIPDALQPSALVETLAGALAPRFRVLSVVPRPDCAYQVQVADLEGVSDQFGLHDLVVVAEGLSCASALLWAAWVPGRVGVLVLVDAVTPGEGDSLVVRSLRDCPPDWASIRSGLRCPIVELAGASPSIGPEVERLLESQLP